MHARSAEALSAARDSWEPVVRGVPGRAGELGLEIFSLVDTIDASAALRRALTDPNRSGQDRATLVARLFSGRISGEVLDLVTGMARRDWSEEEDFAEALQEIGITTMLMSAEQAGRLEQVESELHGVHRLVDGNRDLRRALLDRSAQPRQRAELVERVFGDTVAYETVQLARRVYARPRTNNPTGELTRLIALAAARRDHLVASVRSAVPLDDAQIARLQGVLERRYGRPVDVHVGVDPEVLGGMRIRVGSDLIDDTIARRLDDVRRRMSA